jgi:hypothetical protein
MKPRRPGRICTILSAAAALLLSLAFPLAAYAGMEEEAERQLQLAEKDLDAGNCERAALSAASAQRADPSRHEAFVVRALALQCLGHLEDAAALLRAYKVLRDKLPHDERVEPALAEIERTLEGPGEVEVVEEVAAAGPIDGPVAVLYGPDSDEKAAERAYAAAQPYLTGRPAVAVLTFRSVLPRGDDLIVVGSQPVTCDGVVLEGALDEHLASAEAAAPDFKPDIVDEAAAKAELLLACGEAGVDPDAVGRLLAARAQTRWVAGEPEGATLLWQEMFAVAPDRTIDMSLSPSAKALQLDAQTRASQEAAGADLHAVLPRGWSLRIDGVGTDLEVKVVPGRRIVRLAGPKGERVGLVLPVKRGRRVLVGTADALFEALFGPRPPGLVLGWVGGKLSPILEQEGAEAAVVVNLNTKPPTVRLFDGRSFLVVTPTPEKEQRAIAAAGNRLGPHPASVALLGGGLAATAVGVILAAVAQGDGAALQADVDAQPDAEAAQAAYDTVLAPYEAARTRERIGTGLAIGGGVVAVVGGITFVLPQAGKPKAVVEVAGR